MQHLLPTAFRTSYRLLLRLVLLPVLEQPELEWEWELELERLPAHRNWCRMRYLDSTDAHIWYNDWLRQLLPAVLPKHEPVQPALPAVLLLPDALLLLQQQWYVLNTAVDVENALHRTHSNSTTGS